MTIKVCTKCNKSKNTSLFPTKKESKDGLHSWCKDCKYKDRLRYRRAKNYKQHGREYYYRNKEKWRGIKARRRAAELNSIPAWLSDDDRWLIDEIYRFVALKSSILGIVYEVDHIIPLQGEAVCGLHVPWNLQLLTRSANRSKGNKI